MRWSPLWRHSSVLWSWSQAVAPEGGKVKCQGDHHSLKGSSSQSSAVVVSSWTVVELAPSLLIIEASTHRTHTHTTSLTTQRVLFLRLHCSLQTLQSSLSLPLYYFLFIRSFSSFSTFCPSFSRLVIQSPNLIGRSGGGGTGKSYTLCLQEGEREELCVEFSSSDNSSRVAFIWYFVCLPSTISWWQPEHSTVNTDGQLKVADRHPLTFSHYMALISS